MRKKRVKKKALIIGTCVVCVLFLIRVLFFESVLMSEYQLKDFPGSDKYKQYIMFQKEFRLWSSSILLSGGRWVRYEYDFMLQGQYRELVEQIRNDMYEELEALVNDYHSVSHYEVNEKSNEVTVYYAQNPNETEETDFRGEYLHDRVNNNLEYLYELWCIFSKSGKDRYDIDFMVYMENIYCE